jgi:3-hydroxybutyryl-CoA dehydrogenase
MKVVVLTAKAVPLLFPAADCVIVATTDELAKHRDADFCIDLDFVPEEARLAALSRMLPCPVIVNEVTTTMAEMGHPFIRINGWPGMLERSVHELSVPDTAAAAQVARLYESGCSFRLAPDLPGMITARILAVLINEAWYTWQEGVSSKEEIDTAMRLGTNYPLGPFEWGTRIGLNRVVDLLEVMSRSDIRHIPAASLKKAGSGIKI